MEVAKHFLRCRPLLHHNSTEIGHLNLKIKPTRSSSSFKSNLPFHFQFHCNKRGLLGLNYLHNSNSTSGRACSSLAKRTCFGPSRKFLTQLQHTQKGSYMLLPRSLSTITMQNSDSFLPQRNSVSSTSLALSCSYSGSGYPFLLGTINYASLPGRNQYLLSKSYSGASQLLYCQQNRFFIATSGSKGENREKKDDKLKSTTDLDDEDDKNLGVYQRFKKLWKKYWYLVLPVHIVSSVMFFGSFYAIAASGVDIIAFMEWLNFVPDYMLNKVKNTPSAANVAIAYLLYKIASPVRYMVTIGGTTWLIRHGQARDLPTAHEVGENVKDYVEVHRDRMRVRVAAAKERRFRFYRTRRAYRRFKTYFRRRHLNGKHKNGNGHHHPK